MSDDNNATKHLEEAIKAINSGSHLFDVTIVCTTDDHQASYWMERLAAGVCASSSSSQTSSSQDVNHENTNGKYPMVLAVSEDWEGSSGAGNGLGTLYAFQKACRLAEQLYQINLLDELSKGNVAAALYHTAGKGTRLAPLPASENNNKPGVKLPFVLKMRDGSYQPLTVLEAVVKQTGIYACSRKGRLSVFWGDQVFLPSVSYQYTPTHHADILCTLLGDTAPTAEEWVAQGLDKYGVIACLSKEGSGDRLDAAQVEKIDHATATQMLTSLGSIKQVGPSLGSFSVSAALLNSLCEEFASELEGKTEKFDTDPHFWMPMTLSSNDYIRLMLQKGVDEETSRLHHERMTVMKEKFEETHCNTYTGLFGAVDVGKDACWWDYGQLKLYSQNSLILLEDSQSADLLRKFLGMEPGQKQIDCSLSENVTVDDKSFVFASKIANDSEIHASILASVCAGNVNADGALIVNCAAKKIKAGKGSICYNLVDDSEEGIVAESGQVIVSVSNERGESFLLKSRMDIDGGKVWKEKLDFNELSFEQVHAKNRDANIQKIEKKRQEKYNKSASML